MEVSLLKKQSAEQTLTSLSAGSKNTLSHFCGTLRNDCERDIFDDRMHDLLDKVLYDPKLLERVRTHCNRYHYSQSRKEYSQLVTQLESFCKPNHPSFRWNRNYQQSKELMKKQFKSANLKSLIFKSDLDIMDALPKKNTHSGWSYIETGLRQKGEYAEGIFDAYMDQVSQAKHDLSFNKIILPGVRTQCGNIFDEDGTPFNKEAKHKTRLVSMIDIYVIIAELTVAKPIQNWMSNACHWYAGGKDDRVIGSTVNIARSRKDEWISLDYSKYDQSISNWLIEDAFEIIESAFLAINDKELFELVKHDFINKVFIDGYQNLHYSRKGVPSGSMFTQIIDSIVNFLMIQTYMLSQDKIFECIIMGDDNLIYSNSSLDNDHISTYLLKNFGITVNATKSCSGHAKQHPEFLSRSWTYLGPWRTPEILICKLLFPEKFRDYTLVSPELILYSYILAYRMGLDEVMDIVTFCQDLGLRESEVIKVGGKYLPGFLAFRSEYLR